jgi:hypothetical protein
MAGAGGRTAVKLRIADALAGKPIMIIPAGNASMQKLDINRMFDAIMAREASGGSSKASSHSSEDND